MQIFQMLLFLESIHAGPESVVRIGQKLTISDQAMKRFFHQVFAFLDVIENLAPEDKKAAVNPASGTRDVGDFLNHTVGLE